MARFLYSVTMSLDGFIAGPGGDMSWLTLVPRPSLTTRPTAQRDDASTLRVVVNSIWG